MMRLVCVGLGVVAAAGAGIACGSSGGEAEPGGASADDTRQMLGHLASELWVPAVDDFADQAKALDEAATAYGEAPDDDDLRDAAREAWRAAMGSWQLLEPLQIGPASPQQDGGANDPGLDLRAQIYSWPTTGLCKVDQVLTSRDYEANDFHETQGINARGLDVLEYLLFNDSDDGACPPTVDIIEDGSWDAAVADGLGPRRAAYAAVLAEDVRTQADALVEAWKSFRGELSNAGDGSDVYDMTQDALNAVTDGLFYLDTETKSMKLGVPSGHAEGCGEDTCPEDVEFAYAQVSKQAIQANLQGAERAFRGPCTSDSEDICGLFDLLRSVGAGDLARRMSQALDGAQEAVDAIQPGLKVSLEAGDPEAGEAYEALRELTVLMKTEFLAILDLSAPASAAADND